MPTKLPSGLLIYNATSHDIHLWVEGKGVIVVPYDVPLNARPFYETQKEGELYTLISVEDRPVQRGWDLISSIRKDWPDALIVGSLIAARAYPEEVVSQVLLKRRLEFGDNPPILGSSDTFIVFPKEK